MFTINNLASLIMAINIRCSATATGVSYSIFRILANVGSKWRALPLSLFKESRLTASTTRIFLLAALFALANSVTGFAQLPCGVANQITCQPWDSGFNLVASQNDTNQNGFGNFATTYQQFTFTQTWAVESFH
jgi:hypothetical protein